MYWWFIFLWAEETRAEMAQVAWGLFKPGKALLLGCVTGMLMRFSGRRFLSKRRTSFLLVLRKKHSSPDMTSDNDIRHVELRAAIATGQTHIVCFKYVDTRQEDLQNVEVWITTNKCWSESEMGCRWSDKVKQKLSVAAKTTSGI
jgi:hypothetical protein